MSALQWSICRWRCRPQVKYDHLVAAQRGAGHGRTVRYRPITARQHMPKHAGRWGGNSLSGARPARRPRRQNLSDQAPAARRSSRQRHHPNGFARDIPAAPRKSLPLACQQRFGNRLHPTPNTAKRFPATRLIEMIIRGAYLRALRVARPISRARLSDDPETITDRLLSLSHCSTIGEDRGHANYRNRQRFAHGCA